MPSSNETEFLKITASIATLELALKNAEQALSGPAKLFNKVSKMLNANTADESKSLDYLLHVPNFALSYADLQRKVGLIQAELSTLRARLDNLAEIAREQRIMEEFPQAIEAYLNKHKAAQQHNQRVFTEAKQHELEMAKLKAERQARERKIREEGEAFQSDVKNNPHAWSRAVAAAQDVIAKTIAKIQQLATKQAADDLFLNAAVQDQGQSFFAELNAINDSTNNATIYAVADRIILLFNNRFGMNTKHLWKCWDVVSRAQALKKAEVNARQTSGKLNELAEYAAASKRIFKTLSQQLPIELQPLKVLFEISDHSTIVDFLRKYFAIGSQDNAAQVDLINEMHRTVEALSIERATNDLAQQYPKFKQLRPELKNPLIEQRAFIILLTSYYDFAAHKGDKFNAEQQELRNYIRRLNDNVANSIKFQDLDDQVVAQGLLEYQAIKRQLATIDTDKRNNLFIDNTVDSIVGFSRAIQDKLLATSPTEAANPLAPSPLSPAVYMMGALYLAYAYSLGFIPAIASMANAAASTAGLVGGGAVIKNRIEANTAVIPELAKQQIELEQLTAADAAFLHNEDEYWNKIKKINTTADVGIVKNEYFKNKYNAVKQKLTESYLKKEKEFKRAVRKIATDSTSSWKDLFFAAIQVMSGVALVVTVVLVTVFALSGLTGPFLLFAFVPALSTSIIAALAVIAAKLNFEGNKTANDLIDWFVWLAYTPVLLVSSAIEFLLRPVTLTAAMLQKDSDGISPSRRSKITAVATIILAIGLAAALGVALPYLAPIFGIGAGVALAAGIIAGAYTGLTLGVLAKGAFDRIYNRPKVRLSKAKSTLLPALELNDPENEPAVVTEFKQKIPELAPQILKLLNERAQDILSDVNALETELPQLWAAVRVHANSAQPQPTVEAHAEEVTATAAIPTPEDMIHERINSIAVKITNLQASQDLLLDAFGNFNTNPSEANSLIFAGAIEDILLTEYEIAKQKFEATSLNRVTKANDPQYQESIKPSIIFNKDPNSPGLVKEPSFKVPDIVSHEQERKKITELHELEEKSRSIIKERILPR